MFARIFTRILRAWQAKRKLVALLIQSHGEHTEAIVLLDDTGSAYQISVHASGLYFRPTITISEYLPDTMRVIQQRAFFVSLFSLGRNLEASFSIVEAWMRQNKGKRLPQDEEMKLVEAMFAKGKKPNKAPEPTTMAVTPRATSCIFE